jgi:hypothetical protein
VSTTVTPDRRCLGPGCRRAIDCLAPDAKFCSNACRQRAYRSRNATAPQLQPDPALLRRHEAALEVVRRNPDMSEGERLDLLAAVVWPEDERLRAGMVERWGRLS